MFIVNCRHCAEAYYVNGLKREEWEELHRKNPEACDYCGETI